MPISRSATTMAMLLGTAATAAGLNLSVLGLKTEPVSSGGEAAEVAQAAPAEGLAIAEALPPVDGQPAVEAPPLAPPEDNPVDAGTEQPALVVVAGADGGTTAAPQAWTATSPSAPTAATAAPAAAAPPVQTQPPSPTTQAPTTQRKVATVQTTRPATMATTATTARRTAPVPTTAPTTQPTPAPTTQAPTTAANDSIDYVTDEFRGVATIQVAVHDGQRLELVSVSPEEGMAFQVEIQSATQIKIQFRPRRGGEESEWRMTLVGGQPRIDKER